VEARRLFENRACSLRGRLRTFSYLGAVESCSSHETKSMSRRGARYEIMEPLPRWKAVVDDGKLV
jgi:hypothetical protein